MISTATQKQSSLTRRQLGLLPSELDVYAYEMNGYYVSPKIIPDELLDAVLAGTERFYRGQLDEGPAIPPEHIPSGGPYHGLRKHPYSAFRCAAIDKLIRHPLVAATAARLAGLDEIRLWRDELVYKPPGVAEETGVSWRRDRAHWPHCTSTLMLTACIPLTSVSRKMGALQVIPGSRHWRFEGIDALTLTDQDLRQHEANLSAKGFTVDPVHLELERGQVSFHHCLTFHTSAENTSDRPQQNLIVHLQDGDNRYQRPARSKLDWDHKLVRRDAQGRPDFTDPVYCPTLWRKQVRHDVFL